MLRSILIAAVFYGLAILNLNVVGLLFCFNFTEHVPIIIQPVLFHVPETLNDMRQPFTRELEGFPRDYWTETGAALVSSRCRVAAGIGTA